MHYNIIHMKPKKKAKKTKKTKKIVKTYLTKKGYTLIKEEFGFRDIHKCKKQLTVAPYVNKEFAAKPSPFAVYLENSNKLYIPHGIEMFGNQKKKVAEGKDIDIEFKENFEITKPL